MAVLNVSRYSNYIHCILPNFLHLNVNTMKEFDLDEYKRMCVEIVGGRVSQDYVPNQDASQNGLMAYFPKEGVTLGLYRTYALSSCEFDSNWEWIMAVVERIGINYDWSLEKVGNDYQVLIYISQTNVISTDKKEGVVQAIWEFLNWYKQNKV